MQSDQNSHQFEITSVRAAPAGATYLGLIGFAYKPSLFHPVKITRSVERDDGWKKFVDAEIDGAKTIRIQSAFLRRSQKGQLYVQSNQIDLQWDLQRAVAEKAFQMLSETEK